MSKNISHYFHTFTKDLSDTIPEMGIHGAILE